MVLFLLQDLLNFEDPLNVEAAEHYERDKVCDIGELTPGCNKICRKSHSAIEVLYNYAHWKFTSYPAALSIRFGIAGRMGLVGGTTPSLGPLEAVWI